MRLPSPGFLFAAFWQVCLRFPGAMMATVLGTVACFSLVDASHATESEDFYTRSWMVCQLGLPFLTALVIYAESRSWSKQRQILLQLLGFVSLIGCWFWLDVEAMDFNQKVIPQYITLLLIGHLAVAVAPYLNNRPVRDFWEYNREVFANLIVGFAFTLILYAGLALAILAIDHLFGTNIQELVYAKLFILLVGIFNTSYFLYHFPSQYSFEEAEGNAYNLVFRNLCKYILIPIVILYFVILYAYSAKIGLEWSLPKGWVSSLVLGFSVAGIFTYLLNFYLPEEDGSLLVKGFKRWFWWVLLPLAGLLLLAIGKRIGDYGVTEERFLVAQLGVWLAAACLYFLFSKNDNLKFIPISLALIALLWAFGPLNAFSVSQRSQTRILTGILERNGRFENGKMKAGKSPLTDPERDQAGSAILYLKERNALKDLLPQPADSAWLEYEGLMKWLGLNIPAESSITSLSISNLEDYITLNIKGFDLAYQLEFQPGQEKEPRESGNIFQLSKDGKMLEWRQMKDGRNILLELYSLEPAILKWLEKQDKEEASTFVRLPVQERTVQLSGRKASIRLIPENLEIEVVGSDKRLKYCHGWLLFKDLSNSK